MSRSEAKLRKKVGNVLAERLVRNAVLGLQAENLPPTPELTGQMVRMIYAMHAPNNAEEAQLAKETVDRTLTEIDAGEWDARILRWSSNA